MTQTVRNGVATAQEAPPEKLFAVTTRSRLRGPWFFPHMLIGTLRVRSQLKHTGNVVQWASIIASPTEFWTITVWHSRHDMQEFMRSGAHDDIMWLFSKWLKSFWLMRWRPGPLEVGEWKGLSMAQPEPQYPSDGPRPEALEQALEHLPKLRSAMSDEGTCSYDTSPYAKRRRAEVGAAGGGIVHIRTSPARTVGAIRALRRLEHEARLDPDYLKGVIGMSRPGQVYLLTVGRDRPGTRRMIRSPQLRKLKERFPGTWASEWFHENEFGHWDGLRLRRPRSRYSIQMPKAALDLDLDVPVETTEAQEEVSRA